MVARCRRQRLRSSGVLPGRDSDAHFRAASVDLLQSASQKYSVDSRFRGGGGDMAGYGGDSMYQVGTGPGSTENEYAYVWETAPDDAGAQLGRRLDYSDPTLAHHVQHCPQKPPRGAPYVSRQTSLAPSSEYESTTPSSAVVSRLAVEQSFEDNRQCGHGQFA